MLTAASDASLLHVAGLRLGFDNRILLNDLDLSIGSGEFWFIVGPNGAGKSSLLSALLGLLSPLAGTIQWHPALANRKQLAWIPQQSALRDVFRIPLWEFVELGLVGLGLSGQARRTQIEGSLRQLGLQDLARQDYHTLSGGQQQRAIIARALARRPRLILLDEPAKGLDWTVEHQLYEDLARLNSTENISLLCVCHDLEVARRYGSHVVLLARGQARVGAPHDVLAERTVREAFGQPLQEHV